MPSYYLPPDVITLYAIADNWRYDPNLNSHESSRTNTPHDAQSLTRLVSNSCVAAQDPFSEIVEQFVNWYRKFQKKNLNEMGALELEDELWRLLADIDDLFFFFSTLTRKVRRAIGVAETHGNRWHFEHLLYILVHEMCHAYLEIFSDQWHPKHSEWVDDFKGHGEMFWVLLRFVSEKIEMFTQSVTGS
ncbi:hypothetical protein F4824DRAFT_486248 [Ustulina deusta]|nr:hypothetical protein F4824DRAFT_486248 [Ustulina deusta]